MLESATMQIHLQEQKIKRSRTNYQEIGWLSGELTTKLYATVSEKGCPKYEIMTISTILLGVLFLYRIGMVKANYLENKLGGHNAAEMTLMPLEDKWKILIMKIFVIRKKAI